MEIQPLCIHAYQTGTGRRYSNVRIQHMLYATSGYHYHRVWDESNGGSTNVNVVATPMFIAQLSSVSQLRVSAGPGSRTRQIERCWPTPTCQSPRNWIIGHCFGYVIVFMVFCSWCLLILQISMKARHWICAFEIKLALVALEWKQWMKFQQKYRK